jgi:DNA-directed RNA polymerase specialized sigma24 family protein
LGGLGRERKWIVSNVKRRLADVPSDAAQPRLVVFSELNSSLARRWRDGDVCLIAEVLRWACGDLARRLRRTSHWSLSTDYAEDVAVASVERAWECRSACDTASGNLQGWVGAIADHQLADLLRSRWHQGRNRDPAVNIDRLPCAPEARTCDEIDADDVAPADISPEILKVTDDCLSANQRHVLLADARSRNGLANAEELAIELNVRRENVPVLRLRARRKLGAELDRSGLAPTTARKK